MTDELDALAARLEKREASNALDVLVEIALFKPCKAMASIQANSAGTKVIYTDHAGRDHTHWAPDWSGKLARRRYAIDALRERLMEKNNAG